MTLEEAVAKSQKVVRRNAVLVAIFVIIWGLGFIYLKLPEGALRIGTSPWKEQNAPERAAFAGSPLFPKANPTEKLGYDVMTATSLAQSLLAREELYGDKLFAVSPKNQLKVTVVRVRENGTTTPASYKLTGISDKKPLGVEAPANHVILAVRRIATVLGKEMDVTRTPWHPALEEQIAIDAGVTHWWQTIKQAEAELRSEGVRSKLDPSRLVVDVIPPHKIFPIPFAEHGGNEIFKSDPVPTYRKILTTIGLNPKSAFATTSSEREAIGIAAHVSQHFENLRKAYPEANILPAPEGLVDHKTAAKAAFLNFDDNAATMQNYKRDSPAKFGTINATSFPLLAGAYNGGPERSRRVFLENADQEIPEVTGYVKKTFITYSYFFPNAPL